MKEEPENIDVLQNLEFAVVQVWRKHPDMSDHVAGRAYEAAFQFYRAEARGHEPKPPVLSGLDLVTFQSIQAMCEFRLGRAGSPVPDDEESIPPIPVQKLVDCLRELYKSVERHTRVGGRQGYLTFIARYFP